MYKALSALVATATITVVLAVGSASIVAQESRTNDPAVTTASDTRQDDQGFDYGWLGLAGLVGLLGLMPRDRSGITVRDGSGNVKDTIRK